LKVVMPIVSGGAGKDKEFVERKFASSRKAAKTQRKSLATLRLCARTDDNQSRVLKELRLRGS